MEPEEESGQDLDASMEDLDEEPAGDMTEETFDEAGELTEELEEEPNSFLS